MIINGYKIEKMANLTGANLTGANLTYANLTYANLTGANLTYANLTYANLMYANLLYANLTYTGLRGANLMDANLMDANLTGANLKDANLTGANLKDANLTGAKLPHFQIVPEVGSFTCWKCVSNNTILELLVPANAKRTSCLASRKCRVECVRVIAATTKAGVPVTGEWTSCTCIETPLRYRVGDLVHADLYDNDIRKECTNGIHVFVTRQEAVEWVQA